MDPHAWQMFLIHLGLNTDGMADNIDAEVETLLELELCDYLHSLNLNPGPQGY